MAGPGGGGVAGVFHAIGIDVGGTKIAAGVVALPEGRVMVRRAIPTLPARGGEAVLAEVLDLARALTGEARSRGVEVRGLGLGLCELVDPAGRIASASAIHWQDLPVRERLSAVAPAVIEADVRAAALAEALFGAGKLFRVFLYITVGTGISCALVVDGRPFLGAHGATGTMASSPLIPGCESCRAGARPTLEEIASGPGLVARHAERGARPFPSAVELLDAAESGDAEARAIVERGGEALGATVGLLVNVLDPEAVVIGGGLGLREGIYRDGLVRAARAQIWSEETRQLPILSAATGRDAGVIGAAAAAWTNLAPQAGR
jgi:glucokinase